MVFLFIGVFGIIILFCCPFRVGINAFSAKNGKKIIFSIRILSFVKTVGKSHNKKKQQKAKKKLFKIKINKNLSNIFSKIIPDKIFLEGCFSTDNASLFYPAVVFINLFNQILDLKFNSNARISLVTDSNEDYFQFRFFTKINLHIIFSLILQTLKIEIRRK